jgi:hypothetical protein
LIVLGLDVDCHLRLYFDWLRLPGKPLTIYVPTMGVYGSKLVILELGPDLKSIRRR